MLCLPPAPRLVEFVSPCPKPYKTAVPTSGCGPFKTNTIHRHRPAFRHAPKVQHSYTSLSHDVHLCITIHLPLQD